VKISRMCTYYPKLGWLKYLLLEKIDLGSGKRALITDGVYVSKYQITIPHALSGAVL